MDKRPFSQQSLQPTEESLKNILSYTYQLYHELNGLTIRFQKEWNFSKSSGWMQKVHDGKKALYYFIPLNDSFIISLTLREQEKTEFLSDSDLNELNDQLKNAKKYVEGYALKFLINDRESFPQCFTLIEKLTEKRK